MTKTTDQTVEQLKTETDFFRKAQLLKELHIDQHVPIIAISKKIGLKPSYICHILRLNKIPELIVDGYYSNSITISHLFILSRIRDTAMMIEAYEKVLSNNYTVLQTELLVREILYGVKKEQTYLSQKRIEEITRESSSDLMKVHIVQSRGKCKVQIEIGGSIKETSSIVDKLLDCVKTLQIGKRK